MFLYSKDEYCFLSGIAAQLSRIENNPLFYQKDGSLLPEIFQSSLLQKAEKLVEPYVLMTKIVDYSPIEQ